MITGVIEEFDAQGGFGYLLADDGVRFFFHCVAISDATRQIEIGVRAGGTRAVGRVGRDEIVDVHPVV